VVRDGTVICPSSTRSHLYRATTKSALTGAYHNTFYIFKNSVLDVMEILADKFPSSFRTSPSEFGEMVENSQYRKFDGRI